MNKAKKYELDPQVQPEANLKINFKFQCTQQTRKNLFRFLKIEKN